MGDKDPCSTVPSTGPATGARGWPASNSPDEEARGNGPAVILIGRAESLEQMGFFGPDDGRMQENVGERSEQHGPLVAVQRKMPVHIKILPA